VTDEQPLPIRRSDARDLPSLRAGQRVLVGPDGSVVSPRVHRRRLAAQYGLLALSCAAFTVLNPPLGAAVSAALAVGGVAQVRWARRLREAIRLVIDDQPDAAERALDALGPPILRRRRRLANVAQIRSLVCERRGDLAGAVAQADVCERLLPTAVRGYALVYWQNQYNRAHWLLELGRLDDARAAVARCGRAPGGEWYKLQYRFLLLHAAFVGAGALPDDDRLSDWLRDSLRYNHTGATLALLGWAFEQRGDADSAQLAFAEAGARFLKGTAVVARVFPRMWAVLGPKLDEAAARAAAEAE
jgi:tetratricopeptide (TPR) repeat protein